MASKNVAGKQVEVTDEGFLTDPLSWTEDMAAELAKEVGIGALTEKHWQVIRFMRTEFFEHGQTPTIRRIKNHSGVTVKEMYALFPDGPAKKAAYVSGLGKPDGCI